MMVCAYMQATVLVGGHTSGWFYNGLLAASGQVSWSMAREQELGELKSRLAQISDLNAAISILHWDQLTNMPPGGGTARGQQIATLSKLSHDMFTNSEIGKLLDALEDYRASLPSDSDDACLLRVTRWDYERATRVPSSFLARWNEHSARSYQAWAEARPVSDFGAVEGFLEKGLDLSREYAAFFPEFSHPADPLIDQSDEGMTVELLRPLFDALRRELVPLVEAIGARGPVDDSVLGRDYPESEQLAFGRKVIEAFGYDFQRGRQDLTMHPFATSFGTGDVRITTRVRQNHLGEGLFSTLHEAGHAMYEQGIGRGLERTPLAIGVSSGVHESQSRLWENLVGRSRSFWEHYFPMLRGHFTEQLAGVTLDTFYKAVNRVAPSLIRTDADEITYNLHVIIRFDLEIELLEGTLAVRDLPEAWRERYVQDLGIEVPDDRDGVLQDVHWYSGGIGGAFQGYALGNILSSQFFEAAEVAEPDLQDQLARGEFHRLLGWLRENIYRHGRKFTPAELVRRATGTDMAIEPYLRYLRRKYGALYGF